MGHWYSGGIRRYEFALLFFPFFIYLSPILTASCLCFLVVLSICLCTSCGPLPSPTYRAPLWCFVLSFGVPLFSLVWRFLCFAYGGQRQRVADCSCASGREGRGCI